MPPPMPPPRLHPTTPWSRRSEGAPGPRREERERRREERADHDEVPPPGRREHLGEEDRIPEHEEQAGARQHVEQPEIALRGQAARHLRGLQRDAVEREVAIDELHDAGIDVLRLHLRQHVDMEARAMRAGQRRVLDDDHGRVGMAHGEVVALAARRQPVRRRLLGRRRGGISPTRRGSPAIHRQACPQGRAGLERGQDGRGDQDLR